jgi:hypothetical protein
MPHKGENDLSMGASKEEYGARRRRRHRSTGYIAFAMALNPVRGSGQGPRALVVSAVAPPVKPTCCRLPSPTPEPPPMH